MKPTVEERFWSKVTKTDTCWLWIGALDRDGYGGAFRVNRETRTGPHRFSYELLVGSIPDGLVIDHLCRVRHCVNPAHLEPVTNAENIRRGETGKNQVGETCIHGHPTTGNRVLRSSGKTYCRECNRVNCRKQWSRRGSAEASHTLLASDISPP